MSTIPSVEEISIEKLGRYREWQVYFKNGLRLFHLQVLSVDR
jgi:hypothetical protein